MYRFEVYVNDELKFSILADYYKEGWLTRNINFYVRKPSGLFQKERVGQFDYTKEHVMVKRLLS